MAEGVARRPVGPEAHHRSDSDQCTGTESATFRHIGAKPHPQHGAAGLTGGYEPS